MKNNIKPPKFASEPFYKTRIPADLYSAIQSEYKSMKFMSLEHVPTFNKEYGAITLMGISRHGSDSPDLGYSPVSGKLIDKCYEMLTPMISEWCGRELTRSWGYGIRSYGRNSVLHLHRDRIDTHVISCIIHVDEHVDEPWPLDFIDHEGVHRKVIFEPGEVLFYESLCPHARLVPFKGEYYRNMYLHWRPVDWDPTPFRAMKSVFTGLDDCLLSYRD